MKKQVISMVLALIMVLGMAPWSTTPVKAATNPDAEVIASQYTIVYRSNGGMDSPNGQTKQHGVDLTLTSAIPNRLGYNFLGWSTSSSAVTATYKPGDTFTDDKNTTLYAVWQSAAVISPDVTDSSFSATVLFANGCTYYSFSPEETGFYTFESAGDVDTVIGLYDHGGTLIRADNDSGADRNFLMSCELTGGKQYYIRMRLYNNRAGSFSFRVTQSVSGITQHPSSVIATAMEEVFFTVAAIGPDLTYQWQFRAIPSAPWTNNTCTSATLTFRRAESWRNGYQYRCVVTDARGNKSYSHAATLIVKEAITINKQPAPVTTTPAGKATFTVDATGAGLSYLWQFMPVNDDEWYDNSCTSATLTFSPAYAWRNGFQYRCKVTDELGNTVYSDAATLTIKPGITITAQPISVTTTPAGQADFTVAATGTGLTYQWQFRANSGAAWANNACKTATLTFSPVYAWRNGFQYRCKVTDELGNTVYSDAATLTVEPDITITAQPISVTTTPAGQADFTVAATGTGLTYQWQFRASPSAAWANNTCQSATLTFNPAAAWRNGYQYRCVITDANGNKAYSNVATLTVK